jgi:hypothetical protein
MSEEVKKIEIIVSDAIPVKSEDAKPKKDRVESIIKIVGIIFTVITLIFTYRTYEASEKWKRTEFIQPKLKEFTDNQSAKIVSSLLDYNVRLVPLFKKDSLHKITDNVLNSALVIDTINAKFTTIEVKLRDTFDEYFDLLTTFNLYAKSKLIEYEDLKPFFAYQLGIIFDPKNTRKSTELKNTIKAYITYYQFAGVNELAEKLVNTKE